MITTRIQAITTQLSKNIVISGVQSGKPTSASSSKARSAGVAVADMVGYCSVAKALEALVVAAEATDRSVDWGV